MKKQISFAIILLTSIFYTISVAIGDIDKTKTIKGKVLLRFVITKERWMRYTKITEYLHDT